MAKTLKIRDLTLRDGQQSSFATRMTQAQIDRCLPYYKDANFYAMEVWGGAVPDSVMRYLNENPWTRLETIHKAVGGVSKLTALSRAATSSGMPLYRPDHRRILPQCHPERPGHHAYLRCTERREQREIDHQIRQAVRRHRRLRGLLYGRSEIPRTGILRATHGEEETPPGLYRRLLPRQGGTDGSTRRRHDYDQGHVGPDSADARERAGQAAQTARRRTDRFPHPLHAGLRSGIGPERHSGRSRHRRHQLLVLRRRHWVRRPSS